MKKSGMHKMKNGTMMKDEMMKGYGKKKGSKKK